MSFEYWVSLLGIVVLFWLIWALCFIVYRRGYREGFMDSTRELIVKAFEEAGFEDKETIQ